MVLYTMQSMIDVMHINRSTFYCYGGTMSADKSVFGASALMER